MTFCVALATALSVAIGRRSTCDEALAGVDPPNASTSAGTWRRTVDGWERTTEWRLRPIVVQGAGAPLPHPALVAALELLISLLALVAFATERSTREQGQTRTNTEIRLPSPIGQPRRPCA